VNQIAASILAADFANLGSDVSAVLKAGAHTIHFDVMDHHYVPNLSVGAMVCQSLRQYGITAMIDVHLMVTDPASYIEPFAKAGADIVSFHPETVDNVASVVEQIRSHGMQAGLVFNPDQTVDIPPPLLAEINMILLMSVYPGFGGQSFMPTVLEKIEKTCAWLRQHKVNHVTLAVDGGVKVDNIAQIAKAGANYFVLGSGLFNAENYHQRIAELKSAIDEI